MGDYLFYNALRLALRLARVIPLRASLWVASWAGWFYYYFAGRKNRLAYANLKIAFPQKSPGERKRILKEMYRLFAQNAAEVLYLPAMDERFIRAHVRTPQFAVCVEALKAGRGIIFLGCHAGSWEVSNVACALLFKENRYAMLVQPQARMRRVDDLLNRLRQAHGSGVIRVDALKKVVAHLSANHMLGTIADHGGRDGVPVPFFGKPAMTPVGSVKLAQKLGARIVLGFMRRIGGSRHELLFQRFDPVVTGREKEDIEINLRRINAVLEDWLRRYPEEYLWTYKRWKYSPQKKICVLSDQKAGHVKQSLALAAMIGDLGYDIQVQVVGVDFRGAWARFFQMVAGRLAGAKGAWLALSVCLTRGAREALLKEHFDVVISAGSSLAPVNLALRYENNARSFVLMKPGVLRLKSFDGVFIPAHDRPGVRKNVVETIGALCHVTPETMKADFEKLAARYPRLREEVAGRVPRLGVLIGGNAKNYTLGPESVAFLSGQIKKFLDETSGRVFMTTSRRTPPEAVDVLRETFGRDARCPLLVIASEENPEGAVGGIFHLSDVLIVSGESISMVSEAMASGKSVIAFEPRPTQSPNKVRGFLQFCAQKNYIYCVSLNEIYGKLSWILQARPERPSPAETRQRIQDALRTFLQT